MERRQSEINAARSAIAHGSADNMNNMMLELCRTIDDASARVCSEIDGITQALDRIAKALELMGSP